MAADVGIVGDHLKLLLKLLAISYLTEFGCEICKDAGQQFLAGKIQLGGKLMMAALSLPVFQSLLSFITEVLT
jgi:stage III sporulation protein AD